MAYNSEFMKEAIRVAVENVKNGTGGPFGAVVVKDGEIIASSGNTVVPDNDPTAHAEVNAIRKACQGLNSFQLTGCEIYSSCEPCPMCLGAIYWARPKAVYYACTKEDAAEGGFDDSFMAPHSRHTEVSAETIRDIKDLTILAESDVAGVFLAIADEGRRIFVMGHPEYDRYTLDKEYKRDKSKGLPIDLPVNYYPDDDDTQKPKLEWRSHGNILYSNWLNYYVYQTTPYEFIDTAEIVGK